MPGFPPSAAPGSLDDYRSWSGLARFIPMSEPINIYEAKSQLSRLVDRAAAGEEVVIARHGRPIAKLVPYLPKRGPRRLGQFRGQVRASRDFDQMPEDLQAAFEGEE